MSRGDKKSQELLDAHQWQQQEENDLPSRQTLPTILTESASQQYQRVTKCEMRTLALAK